MSSVSLLAIGFRPFFLLAALTAVALVPAWLLVLTGRFVPHGPLDVFSWHAHEMIFGFAGALLTGFFLTAVPSWTRRPRVSGAPLLALVLLWLAGRVAMSVELPLSAGWIAAIDGSFLPLIAGVIAVPIVAARSWRNAAFPVLLLVMGASNLLMHLEASGALVGYGARGRLVAVHAVLLVIVIFGGRVTPLFTRNALQLGDRVRARGLIDSLAIALTGTVLVVHAVPGAEPGLALVALAAAMANGARMRGWCTREALSSPIVWVLHAGYAWVALGLATEAVGATWPGLIAPAAALHAITIGALGTMILGMMSRVALGHTGRPLRVHPVIVAAYAALISAALMRLVGAVAGGTWARPGLYASGTLWTMAFAIYLIVYTRILLSPRPDGKPG